MGRQARSRLLFLLLVLGAPIAASAQSHARFSVEPSDPGTLYGVGFPGEEFTFTTDVIGAARYEVNFDDGDVESNAQLDSEGRAVFRHYYANPRNYTVVMRAFGETGNLIEPVLELDVEVKSPPTPSPTYARFSVSPSDPEIYDDIKLSWSDFTFTAHVSQAESYELDFGDGEVRRDLSPGPGGKTFLRHIYSTQGSFKAELKAWRNDGELVENELLVSVLSPPAAPSHAHFSVMPSDPAMHDDIETPWADFTFTAHVTNAERYELNFGDGTVESFTPSGSDRRAVLRHLYQESGNFNALIKAWRGAEAPIEESFLVSVQAPVAPPDTADLNVPLWLLILAAIATLLAIATAIMAGSGSTDGIRFEATKDRGRVSVLGSTTADDAVSMRVRRDAGRFDITMATGEQQ